MFSHSYTEITVLRDIIAIAIPSGKETLLEKDKKVYIQQVLGGMFTVQTWEGILLRIDGKDAEALGQPIPDERKEITLDSLKEKSLKVIIEEQLKTCYDPEIPVNIVDLGLIYKMNLKQNDNEENIVEIEMTLTAPGCGMGEVLRADIERKLRDIPTIKYVMVDLVFDPPWDSSMMSESAKLTLGFL